MHNEAKALVGGSNSFCHITSLHYSLAAKQQHRHLVLSALTTEWECLLLERYRLRFESVLQKKKKKKARHLLHMYHFFHLRAQKVNYKKLITFSVIFQQKSIQLVTAWLILWNSDFKNGYFICWCEFLKIT